MYVCIFIDYGFRHKIEMTVMAWKLQKDGFQIAV